MEPTQPADQSDIRRELGDLDDLTVTRILELGPRVADLVEVRIRLTQQDQLDEIHKMPSPVVTQVLTVVRAALKRFEEEPERLPTPM